MLPRTVEDITAEWLTQALAQHHPGLVVSSLQKTETIAGTGTKVFVEVEFNDAGRAAGVPNRLLIKGGLTGHQYTEIAASLYLREARFFRDIAPTVPINVPRCEFSDLDIGSGQGIVVIEDLRLRDATFGNALTPVTPSMAAAMLELLARLHASTWNSPEVTQFGIWPDFLPTLLDRDNPAAYYSVGNWRASMLKPYADPIPQRLRDYDVLERGLRAMWLTHGTGPRCLVHGDPHLGNWFFDPDGRPGLLDWQMSMAGPWATDFAEFIISALSVTDRREHERDLLGHYLAHLSGAGADAPDFDAAWLAYRQNILNSVLWVTIPVEMQPEEISAACTERAATAAEDLDILGSLGVR